MPQSLSNIDSRKSAKKKLLQAFSKVEINAGFLPFWDECFDSFKAEIDKCNIGWLSQDDVDEVLYLNYFELSANHGALLGRMKELYSSDWLNELAEKIVADLAEENSYWFYFSLPQININEDIELSDSVFLLRSEQQKTLTGLLPGEPIAAGCMLKVRGAGYVLGSRTQSAFVDALRKVKWALRIADLGGFLKRGKKKPALILELSTSDLEDVDKVRWEAIRPTALQSSHVKLGLGLSTYLGDLQFSPGEWQSTKAESLQYHVGRALRLMDDPISQENVKSIRRSLEWSFDASIDEDDHMRFIKTCIGLEAAISEQNEDIGITEQLSDRCAFLLDKTVSSRMATRSLMKRIYRLRSKLVHGVAVGLSAAERTLAADAERILAMVLKTELEAVIKWREDMRPSEVKSLCRLD